jgi:hypothetical protein
VEALVNIIGLCGDGEVLHWATRGAQVRAGLVKILPVRCIPPPTQFGDVMCGVVDVHCPHIAGDCNGAA